MQMHSAHRLSSRHRRSAHAAAVVGLAGVLAALASGCGGGSSSSSATTSATTTSGATTAPSTTTPPTAAQRQAAAVKALFTYAACMRGKGVDIPDPVKGANGRYAFPQIPAAVLNAPGVQAKAEACAATLPQGSFRRGGQQTPAQRSAFQKFSDCMSAEGVTLGRPGGAPGGPPAGQGQGAPNGQGGGTRTTPRAPGLQPGQGPRPGAGQGQGPRGRGGGFFNSTDPKVQAALAKCRSLLPNGFGRGPGGGFGGSTTPTTTTTTP